MHGGGLIASGPDRHRTGCRRPWAPAGLQLTGLEGAGEVQTPLTGHPAALLEIGDLVWFRHAKSGEPFEHANTVHLLSGHRVRRHGAELPRVWPGLLSVAPAGPRPGPRPGRATLGAGRLLCVDGPAGSGKTTLAAAVAALDRRAGRPHGRPVRGLGRAARRVDAQLDGPADAARRRAARAATAATTGTPARTPRP